MAQTVEKRFLSQSAFGIGFTHDMIDASVGGHMGFSADHRYWVNSANYIPRPLIPIVIQGPRFYQYMNDSAKRLEIFRRLHEDNPEPKTELNYSSPFELLIAVILSAQATDVGVNKATRKLFPVAGTPQAILDLGLERLEGYIKTIGLYRTKARNLMETCRILVERHGGVVRSSPSGRYR
jgi:hypothetical protein